MSGPLPPLPFSFIVPVENLGEAQRSYAIKADPDQRQSISEFLGLQAVSDLKAELTVRRWRSRGIKIEGRFSADVTQQCVVTLQPVPARLQGPVYASLLPEAEVMALEAGQDIETYFANMDDPPEPYDGKQVDLGALLVEFLSLSLDDYPRAPDAAIPPQFTGDD